MKGHKYIRFTLWLTPKNMKHAKSQVEAKGFFSRFKTLDVCYAWCEWYGKDYPRIFTKKKEAEDFIKQQTWNISQEIII